MRCSGGVRREVPGAPRECGWSPVRNGDAMTEPRGAAAGAQTRRTQRHEPPVGRGQAATEAARGSPLDAAFPCSCLNLLPP